MRCSEFDAKPSAPIAYTCGRCAIFYYDHQTLLEHLYWRHGTESQICQSCQLKKWSFATHNCYHLPNMECNFSRRINKPAKKGIIKRKSSEDNKSDAGKHFFAVNELVSINPGDYNGDSDMDSVTSGDSSYFSERESRYCYCGKDIEGSQMIGCDSEACALEWYHYKCVGINEVPLGRWYCPECTKRSE